MFEERLAPHRARSFERRVSGVLASAGRTTLGAAGYSSISASRPIPVYGRCGSLRTARDHGRAVLIGEGTDLSIARDGDGGVPRAARIARSPGRLVLVDGQAKTRIGRAARVAEGLAICPTAGACSPPRSTESGPTTSRPEAAAGSRLDPNDITPEWLGADALAFVRAPGGEAGVDDQASDADGEEVVIATGARFPRATADGRRLIFNVDMEDGSGWQIAWIDVGSSRRDPSHRSAAHWRGASPPCRRTRISAGGPTSPARSATTRSSGRGFRAARASGRSRAKAAAGRCLAAR